MIKFIEKITETERMSVILLFSILTAMVMPAAGIAYVITFSIIYYFGCKEARNAKL